MKYNARFKRLEQPAQSECRFFYIRIIEEGINEEPPPCNAWEFNEVIYSRLAGESHVEFKKRIEAEAINDARLIDGKLTVVFIAYGD